MFSSPQRVKRVKTKQNKQQQKIQFHSSPFLCPYFITPVTFCSHKPNHTHGPFTLSYSLCLLCSAHSHLKILEPQMGENMWCLSFGDWVTSHSVIIFRSIHLPENFVVSFFYTLNNTSLGM